MTKLLSTGIRSVVVCGALALSLDVTAAPAPAAFPIADVVNQVKRELAAAQNTPGANLQLKLDKVDLHFALTRSVDANGKVTVGVPAIGADVGGSVARKSEETSSVAIELAPPRPLGIMSGDDAKDFGITQAIVETRRQLLQGIDGEPKLEPRKVVITLKFTLTRSAGPTGQVRFLVFSVGGGATHSSADASTITLTFSRNAAP